MTAPDLRDPYFQAEQIASEYRRLRDWLEALVEENMRDECGWTESESKAVLYLCGIPKDFADLTLLKAYRKDELHRLLAGEISSIPI